MEDEDFNPWQELAEHGLTRPDQIEDCKDWLTRRQAALDQVKKRFDDRYPLHRPQYNEWENNNLEAAQFRLDIDKWELEEFIKSVEDDPN